MNRFSYLIFKSSLEDRLISPGEKVMISLSGGIDSMSLACLLMDFREKIDLGLHWVHFNHGLRSESRNEEQFIRELSLAKGVPVTVISTNQLAGQKGMQNAAREWRYRNLLQLQQKLGSDKIALGHHLDDLIETQLWRIMRGSSLYALNPMSRYSPPYIRPLLHTPKSDLEAYLTGIGQVWCEDQSNAGDDYTRNLIRNQLLPLMQKCAGGRLSDKLLALDKDARRLKELFDSQVDREQYKTDRLSYTLIQSVPPIIACELIHRFLLHHGQTEITRANIELVYRQVAANIGNWSINLKDGMVVFGRQKAISIRKAP